MPSPHGLIALGVERSAVEALRPRTAVVPLLRLVGQGLTAPTRRGGGRIESTDRLLWAWLRGSLQSGLGPHVVDDENVVRYNPSGCNPPIPTITTWAGHFAFQTLRYCTGSVTRMD